MKTTLCLTLLIFVMLAFVPNSFAQDASPEYVVRQIYFHPSDRQPSQAMKATLDMLVKDVQMFYADEMERHGFGRKTFRFETDALGQIVRHYVKGKFTASHYVLKYIEEADKEINEHFDRTEHLINLIFIDGDSNLLAVSYVGGDGIGSPFNGTANITLLDFDKAPEALYSRAFYVIAHELGHVFGLRHDFRDDHYVMSYGDHVITDQLSYCAAEWLDVHRYFNDSQNSFDQVPTIRMLDPSLVSPPNTIRLRFEVTHSEELHQAQLFKHSRFESPIVNPLLVDWKLLSGNRTTIEFITNELSPLESKYINLHVIDVHGNFVFQQFPLIIDLLLPDSELVSIPDANLAAAIRETLGLVPGSPITKLDMLGLRVLERFQNRINNLTGLQHATNLESLQINYDKVNKISDITPLAGLTKLKRLIITANQISDLSPIEGLTSLSTLVLKGNQISDITPLTRLTLLTFLNLGDNIIADITPLKGLTNLRLLDLSHNRINEGVLMLLTEFPKLNELHLRGNQIRDIASLGRIPRIDYLNFLDLSRNQIVDITPLKGMSNLRSLDLNGNQIVDITPLKDLTNLGVLILDENRISDVSPLAGLTNLKLLYLQGNPIKNRKPLLELLRKNPDVKIHLSDKNGRTKVLPVTLSYFRAELTDVGVVIKWTTESEVDNAGFYIYRSETRDGEFKVVNPSMIQGAGTTAERNEYTWTDTTAKPNTVYYYRIEDVSHAGDREQLATVRLRGFVSASGKLTTRWADFKK